MGLSGPKFRRKLDYDPNNTRWTRDETTFGQKILRSQGWEPGRYLGAQGSAHSQLHSAASLAPIKINLKDDTLGLGAKIRQKQSDECTGLDVFKDLLGRLNGKSEEALEQQRQVRSEIKTNLFVERKYGPMRFVSGGFLVGDQKMQELVDNKPETTTIKEEPISEASEPETIKEKKEKKSKKRKASEPEDSDHADSKSEKKRKKRSKTDKESEIKDVETEKSTKKKKGKKREKSEHSEKVQEEESSAKQVESEVKRKKSKKPKDVLQQTALSNGSAGIPEDTSEKSRRKEKKKDKKRKQANSEEDSEAAATTNSSIVTPQNSGTSTPSNTGASTPQNLSARHLARSRYIASKKMAYSDMQAMNQIFMVKPV